VTEATLEAKKNLYAGQLRAYGRAMARITGRRVGRLVLYFFATGGSVDVDD
jgi:hypothetical protein